MNKIPTSHPAYSLIFAFLLMTTMMIVAGSSIQNTNEKLALYNDLGGSAQAYLAAQSAAEQGIIAIQDTDGDGTNDYSPGYETNQSEAFCTDTDSDGSCNSWADFIVLAEGRAYNGYFYTPIFGTGTAGNTEDCSVMDYIDPSDGTVLSGTIDVDDPCHWNKLVSGTGVSIPLFDTREDGSGTIDTPDDLSGFSDWSLRLRTPCNDGTMDSDCTRYELNEDGEISGEGDTVIFWQLTGVDSTGAEVELIPEDELGIDDFFSESRYYMATNTEIYESLINDAYTSRGDFVTLSADSTTRYQALLDFCETAGLESLYLQLNIVTPLKDTTDAAIPYLEWQLELNSPYAFADSKSVLIGQGYFEGLRNTYYNSYIISRSTTGESSSVYTLSN